MFPLIKKTNRVKVSINPIIRFFSPILNQCSQQDEVESPTKPKGTAHFTPPGDALKHGNVHTFSDTNDKPNPPKQTSNVTAPFFHIDGKDRSRTEVEEEQRHYFPYENTKLTEDPFEEEREVIHKIEEGADEGILEGKQGGQKQTLSSHLERKPYNPTISPWAE